MLLKKWGSCGGQDHFTVNLGINLGLGITSGAVHELIFMGRVLHLYNILLICFHGSLFTYLHWHIIHTSYFNDGQRINSAVYVVVLSESMNFPLTISPS